MKITKFKDLDTETLDIIINRHYNQWIKHNPTLDFNNTAYKFKNIFAVNNEIPFGIAMFDNNLLVGFCVLQFNRLQKYPQFNPWITSIMIFEEFREKGYGKKLINEALQILSSLGFKKAYLWTDQTPDFYKKIGWDFIQIVEKNEGGFAELYCKEI